MPKFKMEVSKLTMFTVTLEAPDAREAGDIVEDLYPSEFDPELRDDAGYLKFTGCRGGLIHVAEETPEFTVHYPPEEVS